MQVVSRVQDLHEAGILSYFPNPKVVGQMFEARFERRALGKKSTGVHLGDRSASNVSSAEVVLTKNLHLWTVSGQNRSQGKCGRRLGMASCSSKEASDKTKGRKQEHHGKGSLSQGHGLKFVSILQSACSRAMEHMAVPHAPSNCNWRMV